MAEFTLADKRIWIAGHTGMVGSAITRRLDKEYCNLLTTTRQTLDLRRQQDVENWMAQEKPDAVILAAAMVGGIHANNDRPADFIADNLMIQTNIIEAAYKTNVKKLVFLGSSCIYPKMAPQPLREESLLTGPLEPTNEWYAIAKIAGLKMCQAYRRQHGCDFISLMPCNLYGPGDNFHPTDSHVLAALMLKCHEAKMSGQSSLEIWGTGTPLREFLFVEDLADATVFLLQNYSDEQFINVGTGEEISINKAATLIADVIGCNVTFSHNTGKPDGAPRKLMDITRLNALGWHAKTPLKEGLAQMYQWFLETQGQAAA